MRLTIGTTPCRNFAEVWFTVQSLRLHHGLGDVEVLVVDDGPDPRLERWIAAWGRGQVRYVRSPERRGPAAAKDLVFRHARGEWVLVIDSHVLLAPGAAAGLLAYAGAHPESRDLVHGPMLYDGLDRCADAMKDEWRGGMWGTWRDAALPPVDAPPFEIQMHGMGCFAARRAAWPGFPAEWRGFGGEEGVIHERVRRAGGRVLCLPVLRWSHLFREGAAPHRVVLEDRVRNYLLAFRELGRDPAPIHRAFGALAARVAAELDAAAGQQS